MAEIIEIVDKNRLSRLLYTNPVCILSIPSYGESCKPNIMTISWLSPINNHGTISLSMNRKRYTATCLQHAIRQELSPHFVLNVPVAGMESLLVKIGSVSGANVDKIRELDIKTCYPGWIPIPTHIPIIPSCQGFKHTDQKQEQDQQQNDDHDEDQDHEEEARGKCSSNKEGNGIEPVEYDTTTNTSSNSITKDTATEMSVDTATTTTDRTGKKSSRTDKGMNKGKGNKGMNKGIVREQLAEGRRRLDSRLIAVEGGGDGDGGGVLTMTTMIDSHSSSISTGDNDNRHGHGRRNDGYDVVPQGKAVADPDGDPDGEVEEGQSQSQGQGRSGSGGGGGHYLIIAQISHAYVRASHWDGAVLCPRTPDTPPLLSFLGGGRFTHMVAGSPRYPPHVPVPVPVPLSLT
eukprot:gene12777-26940_t